MDCPALKLNKRLLPVKASYFFSVAALASLLPYIGIYMKQVGLTPIEASIIGGTMPFIGALVRPFVGAAADKLHAHKVVLMLCCVLSGLFYAGLLFVPHRAQGDPASQTYAVTLNCDHGSSSQYIEYCYREDEDQKCPDKLSVNSSEVYSSTDIGSQPRLNSTRNCHIRCNGAAHTSVASSGISEEMVFDVVTFDRGDSPRHGNSSQTCIRYHFDKPINYTVTTRGVHCQELPCTATCKHELQECASKRHEEQVFDATFWYSFIFSLGANVALSPICSLIDAMTYDYLGDDRGKWGKQRMWGTIGFAVFAVISGLSMDLFSESSSKNKDYTAAFVLYALLSFIAAVFVWFYQIYQISNELTCAKEVLRNLGAVLKRLRAISLLVLLFMFGFYTGLIETFLYWHLSTLGGTKVLFGLCMLVNCLPEIPIMFLAGRIIQTLGYVNMLYVTLIAYAVRLTVYSFITNPWTVLAVEPLHGIAYGLMYSAASSYVSIITPPGMHGVMQGLLAGVHFGLGRGCGTLLSGPIFQHYGALTFCFYGVSALILLVLYWLLQTFVINRLEPLPQSEGPVSLDAKGMPAEKETMLSDPAEVHIKNAERKATATDQQDMTV